MEETKVIKAITPTKCPECGKDIFVCHQQIPSSLNWVLGQKAITRAKEDLTKKINELTFNNKSEKELILKWLDNENTIFGPEDVNSLFKQISSEQDDRKKSNKNQG